MNSTDLSKPIIKNNRHDSVFKLAMHDIKVAQDMIKHYLPKSIVKQLKLETLTLSNSSYIDKDLSATHADILYRAKTKSHNDAYTSFALACAPRS